MKTIASTKYFCQCTPFGQFIDELVEITNRSRELIVEVLDFVATDCSFDQVGIGMKSSLIEKSLERGFSGDMAIKVGLGIAREPLDHLEQLGLTPALLFDFGHIVWIYPSEGECRDAGVMFGSCVCGHGGWWFRYVLQLDALRVALYVDLDEVA